MECRISHECAAGDHTFFVSELLSVELGRPREGLVYVEGGYRSV
jgi:flavin reductase (DIM6/NTAB) family NADH-FMN oxidoreductase RutF